MGKAAAEKRGWVFVDPSFVPVARAQREQLPVFSAYRFDENGSRIERSYLSEELLLEEIARYDAERKATDKVAAAVEKVEKESQALTEAAGEGITSEQAAVELAAAKKAKRAKW